MFIKHSLKNFPGAPWITERLQQRRTRHGSVHWFQTILLGSFLGSLTALAVNGAPLCFYLGLLAGCGILGHRFGGRYLQRAALMGATGCLIVGAAFIPFVTELHEIHWCLLGLGVAPLGLCLTRQLGMAAAPRAVIAWGLPLAALLAAMTAWSDAPNVPRQLFSALLLSGSVLLLLVRPARCRRPGLQRDPPAAYEAVLLPLLAFGVGLLSLATLRLAPSAGVAAALLPFCYTAGVLFVSRCPERAGWPAAPAPLALGAAGASAALLAVPVSTSPVIYHCAFNCGLGALHALFATQLLREAPGVPALGRNFGALAGGMLAGQTLIGTFGIPPEILQAPGWIVVGTLAAFQQAVHERARRQPAPAPAAPPPIPSDQADCVYPPPNTRDIGAPSLDSAGAPGALPAALACALSPKECEMLIHLHAGLTYRAIAGRMGISESSVKTYVQRAFRKLGVRRRRQLQTLIKRALANPDG